jgi:3-phosphoshikimate 1-carboxyvinyltransferase
MRERPIAELADVLRTMGMGVRYLGKPGCPPVAFEPPKDASAFRSSIDIPTTQSSQFISAMLLVAPFLPHGLTVRLTGAVTSASYVEMTIGLLHKLGAVVKTSEDLRILRVGPSTLSKDATPAHAGLPAFTYEVEPDASGATYFWAAAAMCPDSLCTVRGLGAGSLQGDTDFPDELGRMGAAVVKLPPDEHGQPGVSVRGPARLTPILADLTLMPDAAMTLAAVCAFAPGTSILRGLRTLRVKEPDRIAATMNELRKLGVTCVNPTAGDPDVMTITPPEGGIDCSPTCPPVEFDTYDDHRMAMSMALFALRRPNVFIKHPQCVAKTYPTFWREFATLYQATPPARS